MAMFNDVHSLNFQNSNVSHVQGDQHNNLYVIPNIVETTLGLLKPVDRDGYHVPRCMEGTRESVFKEIITWLNGAHIPSFDVVLDYCNLSSSGWLGADTEHLIDHWQPWSWKVCNRV